MKQQETFEACIAGQAYRTIITPQGDESFEVRCERYACGSFHALPAYDRMSLTQHDARNQAQLIFSMLRIGSAVEQAAKANT